MHVSQPNKIMGLANDQYPDPSRSLATAFSTALSSSGVLLKIESMP